MTRLLHSLPWTLALSLAAQAGEPEQDVRVQADSASVQESAGESGRSEIRLHDASQGSAISPDDAGSEMT